MIDRLRHGLIPAVPTPFTPDGVIHSESLEHYAQWMSAESIAGVAVWAHTGRGLMLSIAQREQVLTQWKTALQDKIILAGAGGSRNATTDEEYIASAVEMAKHAKSLGADALLAYAPARFRDYESSKRNALIIEYHHAVNEVGLPVVLFYLYEAAGGISYDAPTLTELLRLSNVIGIKIATLDSVMTYQDVAKLCKLVAPHKLVITGEDRFLGYSLMCGAKAALIGMGAAYTKLQSNFLRAYFTGDFEAFHKLNPLIDRLAQATFIAPMEGYIARMSYLLAKQRIIGADSWHDPWGPAISRAELSALDQLAADFDALH